MNDKTRQHIYFHQSRQVAKQPVSATSLKPVWYNERVNTKSIDRSEYRTKHGLATWWQKDGAWHTALPSQFGELIWTDEAYDTREEAIKAINENAEKV